jgi:uroporphyrinogen decarboxylase
MTSKERVLAVFERRLPDRVPMWCGASPEFMEKARNYLHVPDDEGVLRRFHDDFRRVFSRYVGPQLPAGCSIFGVERHGIGYGQPVSHPLADATLEEIHAYPWPKAEWFDVSHIRDDALVWNGEFAILGGEWCPFFHDAIDLLGMENMMILMYEEPELVHAVLDHIVDFYLAVNEKLFAAAADVIDIFFFGNDFGSQTGPLMGPALFDAFMAPQIRRLCDQARRFGLHTMMHCCGSFFPLMPSIADAGVECLQSLQPITADMEPQALKASLGDRLIFNGCINSISTLIFGTPELAAADTRRVLGIMQPGGGYILSASHDYILEETPVENVLAMFDTGYEQGIYQ